MTRLLATTLILITASALTFGQSRQTRDLLIIGSWNIEDIERGSGQKVQSMADQLGLLRLDVLALNQVDGDSQRQNRQLNAIFELANEEEGQDWQYRLFENKTSSDKGNLGVAWNRDRVRLDREVFRTVTDDGDLWRRPPHAAKFSAGNGRTDIVVVPIQFEPKSRESACLGGRRGEEASDLAGHIQRVRSHFSDDDIVVIGDTECVRDDPDALETFESERFIDLGIGDVVAFSRGQGVYNRVMVPMGQPEFRATTQYTVLEAEGRSANNVMSDHFIMLAPIRILADDD
jgi:hypothetical protein